MEVIHKINEEKRKSGCPFGHCCDNCNLYRPTYRTLQDGKVNQEWDCSFNAMVMFQAETKDMTLGVQRAVESRGNEQIKRQDAFLNLAIESRDAALPRQ